MFGSGTSGSADGTGAAATTTLSNPDARSAAVDSSGNLYWLEGAAIRKCTSAGVVTTLAGSSTSGSADGTGAAASFSAPTLLLLHSDGNLYIGDNGGRSLRKCTPAGVVTTLASLVGTTGSTTLAAHPNGTALLFGDSVNAACGLASISTSGGSITTLVAASSNLVFTGLVDATCAYLSSGPSTPTKVLWKVPLAGGTPIRVGGSSTVSATSPGMVDGPSGPVAGNPGAACSFGAYVSAPGGLAASESAVTTQTPNAFGSTTATTDTTWGWSHLPGIAGLGATAQTSNPTYPTPATPGNFAGGQCFFGSGGRAGANAAGYGSGGGGGVSNVFTTGAPVCGLTNGNGAPGLCIVEY